ncbi:MAG: indolepyruvate oxidoreductase subunit beta [Symbiobacteriaceae bacterium]|nr:indolepyruvate oxidoreductase subunit beta [Symbiobacteriaceae bacterium]
MQDRKILLVGVGGQGTILASKILSWVALAQGKDVKMSEIHGMAQRGGTVTTQICIADRIYSPMIEPGEADVLISLELLEAKRSIHFLKKDGLIIVNDLRLLPMSVITGENIYPEDIVIALKQVSTNLHLIQASQIAVELGNSRVTNVVVLGALAQLWGDVPGSIWEDALIANVPTRFLDLNHQAFSRGRTLIV